MAPSYRFVLYYLWVAPHIFLCATAVLLFTRRLYKNFPIFFIYTLYETLVFLLLFSCYLAGQGMGMLIYRNAFVVTLAGSTALRFGIIQEIFNNIFHDYPRLERLATTSVRWTTGFLVIAAIISVVYSSGTTSDNIMVGVRLLERSVTIIQAGLLLFLFLFSRIFGLSWRSFTFGIAMGFAVFSCTELVKWTLEMGAVTEHAKQLLDLLPTGSYHVCVLIWIGYLLVAERPIIAGTYNVPELDRWSGELERTR